MGGGNVEYCEFSVECQNRIPGLCGACRVKTIPKEGIPPDSPGVRESTSPGDELNRPGNNLYGIPPMKTSFGMTIILPGHPEGHSRAISTEV